MAQKHTIGQLETRKHILEERTDKENSNIIKKIEREIAKLEKEERKQKMNKIDGIEFHELAAERYWSFPSGYKKDSKAETRNMIFSGDYLGARKMDGLIQKRSQLKIKNFGNL